MRRKFILNLFICILCVFTMVLGFTACNSNEPKEKSYEISEDNFQIWLDRYDEVEIALTKGDKDKLEWKSEDENIVTIKKGLAIAQGKGKTNIVVGDGNFSDKIAVTVRNSGKKPNFAFDSIEAYIGVETNIPNEIQYGKNIYKKDLNYTLEILDGTIVEFANNKLVGKKEGSTFANIQASYKGVELRKEIEITVVNPLNVKFEESEITIHNIKNSKIGTAEVEVGGYYLGKKLDDIPQIKITKGEDIIELDGNKVIAKNVGEAEITASITYNNASSSSKCIIKVLPDYDKTEFINPQYEEICWKPYEGEVAGKSSDKYDLMEYKAAPNVGENNEHFFTQRVIENSKGQLLTELYRKGYRYFAFDLYYTADENLMIGCGAYYQWLSVGTFFRNEWLTILSADEGKTPEVINRIEKNRWITLVYDIKALWEIELDKEADFFFFSKECQNTHYLCNARWSYNKNMIPSENIIHEQKDGYIQATNDEFDLAIPINSTGGHIPAEYGKYNGEIEGRMNSYSYKTNISSSYNNALIIASSMNDSYDSGMNKLVSLGNYLTFDIYPKQGSYFTFYMWDRKNIATVEIEKTNLNEFSKWITVICDGKIQNTLKANKWQTIVISYGEEDNYDDLASYSSIMFSANDKDSLVFVDNVRFYEDKSFMPTEYEEETVRPYLLDSATSKLTRIMDGEFKYAYKYTLKNSDVSNAIRFKTVSENGTAGQFFKDGKKYIKFNLFIENNISSIVIGCKGNSNITEFENEILVDTPYDVNTQISIKTIEGRNIDTINTNAWYTLYIPVNYTSKNIENCDIYLYTKAKDNNLEMASYISSLEFIYDINGLYTRDYFDFANLVKVEFLNEGEMKGSWKYSNATSGDLDSDPSDNLNTKNWGESGIAFEGVTKHNDDGAGVFFLNGYTVVKTEFYVGENTKSISVRVSGQREVGAVSEYWVKDIEVDAKLRDPSAVYILDSVGQRALELMRNEWYTLYIPVYYSSPDIGTYGLVSVQSNGGSVSSPSIMYFKNIEYLVEMPNIPDLPDEPTLVNHQTLGDKVIIENVIDGEFANSIKYTNGNMGRINETYGESGVFFDEVYNPHSGTEKATFFKNGYRYIVIEFYVCNNVQSIDFRHGYSANDGWILESTAGSNFNSNSFDLCKVDGSRASSWKYDTWYKLIITPQEGMMLTIQTNAKSAEEAPIMYLRNIEYRKNKPTIIEVPVPENKIDLGKWDYSPISQNVTLETLEDGSILYTNTTIGDIEGDPNMDFGESGFYFKGYYDNKNKSEYSNYKFIAMKFKLLENVKEFTLRINDAKYCVRHIKVGAVVPENVYLYNTDGTKANIVELNKEFIIYIPVSSSDNWDTFLMTGGSKEAPAKMIIYSVNYKENKPQ